MNPKICKAGNGISGDKLELELAVVAPPVAHPDGLKTG
jgi:hypothetical protein